MRSILPSALLLAAALLLGCESTSTDPLPPKHAGQIYGEVYRRLPPQEPLQGVALSWGDEDLLTDAEGGYSFSELEARADTLRVTLEGYRPESRYVDVNQDVHHESFTLMPLDTLPPEPPLSFQVETVDGEYLRLSWTAPEDETRTGFILWKSPGDPQYTLLGSDAGSYDDLMVAPLRYYEYELQCRDAFGNLSEALVAGMEVDTYPSPSELSAEAGSDFESIPLSWTGNADEDFSHFRLYRAEGSNADSTHLLVYEGAETSYLDADVEPNQVYSYRLYSFDLGGQASQSRIVLAAAQVFTRSFDETLQLLALPDGEGFLAAGRNSGWLYQLDGDGAVTDSILPQGGSASWRIGRDGQSLLGYGYTQRFVERLGLNPLSHQGLLASLTDTPGELAELGGDSLAVASWYGGAPALLDLDAWAELGTLELLDDLGRQALLAADPQARRLWAVESDDEDARLFALDLVGEPDILAQATLDGEALGLWALGSGELLLALQGGDPSSPRVQLLDGESLALLDETPFAVPEPDRLFLDAATDHVWMIYYGDNEVCGYERQSGSSLAQLGCVTLPLSMAELPGAERVAIALSDGRVALCLYPQP